MASLVGSAKYDILVAWWQKYCKEFSLFYLMKSSEERKELLLKCSPDMPETSGVTREHQNINKNADGSNKKDDLELTSTDILLPELCIDGLQAGNGRCLILFLTRRLASIDVGLNIDLKLLNSLFNNKKLPLFSNGSFDHLNTPFVDKFDDNETIQSIKSNATKETVDQVFAYLKEGRIIHADVFLACR